MAWAILSSREVNDDVPYGRLYWLVRDLRSMATPGHKHTLGAF